MNNLLEKTATAKTEGGVVIATGRVISYSADPMVCVELASGRLVWWNASLCDYSDEPPPPLQISKPPPSGVRSLPGYKVDLWLFYLLVSNKGEVIHYRQIAEIHPAFDTRENIWTAIARLRIFFKANGLKIENIMDQGYKCL